MSQYSSILGKRVQAFYRASNSRFSAVGILVSDTGRSIFIEEHFSQGGKDKTLRVEIPYEYVVRIAEVPIEPSWL
jgi:hypothetical protein